MTTAEQKARLEHIKKYGVDNSIVPRGNLLNALWVIAAIVARLAKVAVVAAVLWVAIWFAHKNNWQPFRDLLDVFK